MAITDRIKAVRKRRRAAQHKLTLAQKAVQKWRHIRNSRQAHLRDLEHKRETLRSGPAAAVKFLVDHHGYHEDPGRPNRAAWLDKWADLIGAWMRGQPWCGLAIWMAARAAGVNLDKTTVSTVAIRSMAQRGVGGWKAWHPASSTPQLGWCPVYGTATTGPVHVGMWTGKDFIEGNTSPDNGGSQNDGGGEYYKTLAYRRGWILGYAEIDWNYKG